MALTGRCKSWLTLLIEGSNCSETLACGHVPRFLSTMDAMRPRPALTALASGNAGAGLAHSRVQKLPCTEGRGTRGTVSFPGAVATNCLGGVETRADASYHDSTVTGPEEKDAARPR